MKKYPDTPNLHTPEELLDNAETLLISGNPKMMRAAVLEAITALEAFVYQTVFAALQTRFDPLLVKWLEEKTKMDFDSRLSVLTPFATGSQIEKDSQLWEDYKKAKKIRNEVTHSGKQVSLKEAKFVISTVYDWLSYLGSTVELEVALMGLKSYVEEQNISVEANQSAVDIVINYFSKSKALKHQKEAKIREFDRTLIADAILEFGKYNVVIEVKVIRTHLVDKITDLGLKQVKHLMGAGKNLQGVLIIFYKGELPSHLQTIQKLHEGKIYIVAIRG